MLGSSAHHSSSPCACVSFDTIGSAKRKVSLSVWQSVCRAVWCPHGHGMMSGWPQHGVHPPSTCEMVSFQLEIVAFTATGRCPFFHGACSSHHGSISFWPLLFRPNEVQLNFVELSSAQLNSVNLSKLFHFSLPIGASCTGAYTTCLCPAGCRA